MKGKLYGIGVGPGDPELLTLKAARVIGQCGVIAGQKTAFSIVESLLAGKELLDCRFVMEDNMERRIDARNHAAGQIIEQLNAGQDVGFVTLGDPATYSTYMYVHEIIVRAGFDAEIIPGITSFAAAAAALGTALCENDEILTVIPAKRAGDIDALLDMPGNKVFMKSGEQLKLLLEKLKQRGCGAMVASRVTMDGQRLYTSIEKYEKTPETGYFTVAIVKDGKFP